MAARSFLVRPGVARSHEIARQPDHGASVLGGAAFFAIYHPPLSWLPVAAVGAANSVLFKKTGSLAPAIALHMVYNAVALS